ncbi:MAG: hypothetical protein GF383_06895 [Candidatus Lokiarchaeota archaeon]|nr:hypothetical protein [Candidatus Lokiarchaeota archaeon]
MLAREESKRKNIEIYKKFRNGIFYEELYQKYGISEDQLVLILNHNIKGNYDYKRILSGGLEAQKKFIRHLKNRWDPINPEKKWNNISPYLNENEKDS